MTPAVARHPLLAVVGMHRSGTSAMAAALCARGAWAGAPDDLMPPDPHNTLGYFERADTASRLDCLLASLGGSWSEPPPAARLEEASDSVLAAVSEVLAHVLGGVPPGRLPLIKDPRLSLLAAELQHVPGVDPTVIVCVRHPLDVARSLEARNGLPLSRGLALWEIYNARLAQGLAGRQVYVHGMGVPACSADRTAEDVMARHPTQALGSAPAPVLRQDLVHQRTGELDARGWLTRHQLDMWSALERAALAGQPGVLEAWDTSPAAEHELERADARVSAARVRELESRVLALTRRLEAEAEQRAAAHELARRHADSQARQDLERRIREAAGRSGTSSPQGDGNA